MRLNAERGLGWQINKPWMGTHRSLQTFGKTGFTGTSCFVDIERHLALVILSNRTYPQRPANGSAIKRFRAEIADIVRG